MCSWVRMRPGNPISFDHLNCFSPCPKGRVYPASFLWRAQGLLKGIPGLPLDYSVTLKDYGQALGITREEFKGVFTRDQNDFALGPTGAPTMKGSVSPNSSVLSEIRHPNELALSTFAAGLES